MYKFILGFATILLSFSVSARELVFEGYPEKKITLAERESIVLEITKEKSKEFKVVIEKEGDKFFWASRENNQLLPLQSGFYITYVALNGSGYIRVVSGMMRDMYEKMSEEEKQEGYLYMEHLIHTLGSITYYGR